MHIRGLCQLWRHTSICIAQGSRSGGQNKSAAVRASLLHAREIGEKASIVLEYGLMNRIILLFTLESLLGACALLEGALTPGCY